MSGEGITQELKHEVDDLHNRYVQCIDDDDLESWPDFFTEKCLYRVIPRENEEVGLPAAVMWGDSKGMLQDRVVALRSLVNAPFTVSLILEIPQYFQELNCGL